MRAIIQRVSEASVSIDGSVHAAIETGMLILLGVGPEDDQSDIDWLAQKIAKLRIFEDDEGKMNKSLIDIEGNALVISQFTLFASTKKGTRPAFIGAAPPDMAKDLYQQFADALAGMIAEVKTGVFAADMDVALHNDGPVTISIDSKKRE